MSVPAIVRPVPEQGWLDELARREDPVEIVDREFVVKRVGGNPHHYLARRLAEEFERQWPGVVATAPGNWAVTGSPGDIVRGRLPDVLVDGPQLLEDPVYYGAPEAAVEVWSPGNTLEEMNTKRREYREAGLPVFVEAFLTESGDVHLEWLTNAGTRWVSEAVAVGDAALELSRPRAFRIVPNDLLRRR